MVDPHLSMEEDYFLPSVDEKEYLKWLALTRVKGLGCAGFKRIADHFSDPRLVFSASEKELCEVPGLDREAIEGLLTFSGWEEVSNEIRSVFEAEARIVPFNAPNYPARLRTIADPPPFLYVRGELLERDERAVAVV